MRIVMHNVITPKLRNVNVC